MFDNLKESLTSFREDVEEEAVEEVDEETVEEAGEETVEEAGEEEDDTEVESADGESTDEAQTDEATITGAAVEEGEPDEAADGEPDVAPSDDELEEADTADEPRTADEPDAATGDDAPDADDADGAGGGPGLTQRARSLATGKVYIDEDDLEGPLWDLEMALLENDVEMGVAEALLDRLEDELVGERRAVTTRTGSVVEDALREALLEVLSVGQFDLLDRLESVEPPAVIVFTGVNGVGKTTTIAKLSQYLADHGYSSVLANGDTFRAGANEQIEEHAEALDRPLISHDRGGDPAAVIYDAVEYAEAHGIDVVLGDTAGRLHTDEGLMDQLAKIDRVVDPDLTVFVDEAVAGQDAVNRAREFDEAAEIDGAVLTKADADASGGAAISIAQVTGKPILFLGVGQGYADLERFDPEAMVDRLLGE